MLLHWNLCWFRCFFLLPLPSCPPFRGGDRCRVEAADLPCWLSLKMQRAQSTPRFDFSEFSVPSVFEMLGIVGSSLIVLEFRECHLIPHCYYMFSSSYSKSSRSSSSSSSRNSMSFSTNLSSSPHPSSTSSSKSER